MTRLRTVPVHFAQVAWSVVQDPTLSYTAKGIYADLMSRPTDWKISVDALADASDKDGRHRVMNAVNELITAGVYHRVRARQGGVWRTFVVLTAERTTDAEALAQTELPAEFAEVVPDPSEQQNPSIPVGPQKTSETEGLFPTHESPGSRVSGVPETSESSTSEEMSYRRERTTTRARAGARGGAAELPDDYALTPDLAAKARAKGFSDEDAAEEFERFCAHHRAAGSKFKRWDQAWLKWLINAARYRSDREPPSPPNGRRVEPSLRAWMRS